MTVKGVPLAMVAAGGILAWSGLFNKTVTQTIQDLVRGEKPVPGPPGGTPLVSGSGGTGGEVGTGTGNPQGQVIAADALGYQGAGYEWDGVPAGGPGHWDCSSFANWVIGHDTGMTIPGYPRGSYTGTTHGPSTLAWLASIGTVTSRIPRSQLAPGDLCVWQTHMGIAISGRQMISAQNPSSGTRVSGVDGFIPGEVLVCLRLRQVTTTGTKTGPRPHHG